MKLLTVAEMQAVEKAADAAGHSYAAMMAQAGLGLAEVVHERFSGVSPMKILALVGKGNNGGDALVALAHLQTWGWETVHLLCGRERDELVLRAESAGGSGVNWENITGDGLTDLLDGTPILLDGLLGTGARPPLRPPIDAILSRIKRSLMAGTIVVAVDTPSGVDCDTGAAPPEALPADLTVTMAGAKPGHYAFPAASLTGELICTGIGLPAGLPAWDAIRREMIDAEFAGSRLPERPPEAHKGSFGTVVVCAGSRNYTGAALLAGRAAFRSGAGLVTIACPEPVYRMLAGHFPESTWLPLSHQEGAIDEDAAGQLAGQLGRATSLLIGCGFGMALQTGRFIEGLLSHRAVLPPLVVDADGLKLLAGIPEWPARLPPNSILTPHPGEMAVLVEMDAGRVQEHRLDIAERFARTWGHTIVLKGAFTIVAAPDGRTGLVPVATPALARAGTGDVLAGLIAGLRAQGLEAFDAAALGVWLHARSGQIAEKRFGHAAAVLAGDVLDALPSALASLLNQ